VIVPRHPQRFDEVAKLLADRGVRFGRRSGDGAIASDVQVVLGDSMGEMAAYCAAADVVIMGGSLLPLGGQNLIEPLALGKPTIVGAHMFNFAQATADALAAGAAVEVTGAGEALATAGALLGDAERRGRMGMAALAFIDAHRGAGDRLWNWLAPRLDAALERTSA
jgi:3-deoxy-D-manno-octulosonic-acid transferase